MSAVTPAPAKPSVAKAVVAAVLAAVATALTAYFTGTDAITVQGVVAAVVAGAVTGASTYFAPYKPKSEGGFAADLGGILLLLTFVGVVLIFLKVFHVFA